MLPLIASDSTGLGQVRVFDIGQPTDVDSKYKIGRAIGAFAAQPLQHAFFGEYAVHLYPGGLGEPIEHGLNQLGLAVGVGR